jgi:hypothetical protein
LEEELPVILDREEVGERLGQEFVREGLGERLGQEFIREGLGDRLRLEPDLEALFEEDGFM